MDGTDQDKTARSVQSDLDLCCPQKTMILPKRVDRVERVDSLGYVMGVSEACNVSLLSHTSTGISVNHQVSSQMNQSWEVKVRWKKSLLQTGIKFNLQVMIGCLY